MQDLIKSLALNISQEMDDVPVIGIASSSVALMRINLLQQFFL
jgi:hypothetical protein